MKKLSIIITVVMALVLATSVLAADPVISIDFANGAGDVVLEGAELVNDPTRGQVLQVAGMGQGSSRQSFGLLETTAFEDNTWEDGLTISMWIKTDVGSQTLMGSAPIFSIDIARIGYIAVTTSLEPVINNCTMEDFLFQIEFGYALRLGSWLCDWWNYGDYEGMIDDVLVYNTALDAVEISNLYTSTKNEQTVFEKAPTLEELYTSEYIAPVYSNDFATADGLELVDAEIVDGAVKINGKGIPGEGESDNVSYALLTTDLFANTDWTNGLTISMKVKAAKSDTLDGMAPIYSFDIANQGYIGVVTSLQSGINSDGNEDVGIAPRLWNDPANIGSCKSVLTPDQWQTVTVTYGESGMVIYLDGEIVVKPGINNGTYADLAAQLKLVPSLRLGAWLCSWWNFGDFQGMIDDLAIYNKTLNPLEAQQLAAGTYGAAEEVVETPVVETPAEEVVETPVVETPVVVAPQTFDAGVIAIIAAVLSAGAAIVSKKRR